MRIPGGKIYWNHAWMAPAAMITSLLANAVYRVGPPEAGANSMPEAVTGIPPVFHLILVTFERISRHKRTSLENAMYHMLSEC
jgi:hypothetical protein